MLPTQPTRYGSWADMASPIRQGDEGWPVFAVQSVVGVPRDGDFGQATHTAVAKWQDAHGLLADGIVGPLTQAAMLKVEAAKVNREFPDLPHGLLDGFAVYEGANLLAATNWNAPGGVDCGPVQKRVTGPPYRDNELRLAFHTTRAFKFAAMIFHNRVHDYTRRRPSLGEERIIDMAVLAHNAPFLAEQVIRNGKLTTPDALALWTTKPGGGHYTHAEWAIEYPRRILSIAN